MIYIWIILAAFIAGFIIGWVTRAGNSKEKQ